MKRKKRATIVHDTMYYVPLLDSLKVNTIMIIKLLCCYNIVFATSGSFAERGCPGGG